MPRFSTSRSALGWLALACLPSACTGGTPTPEPPDNLPPPLITVEVTTPEITPLRTAQLSATRLAGTVQPGSEAWVVNLDRASVAPVRVRPDAKGAFVVEVAGASSGDRIRVVARTATRHSSPADLVITGAEGMPGKFAAASGLALDCVAIDPSEELTERVDPGERYTRVFTLVNRCSEPVRIDRAALRFGDQGVAVQAPPSPIAVGGEAQLSVTLTGHADASERAEIVLLELAADRPGRYALGVYSVSASSIGNP